ncbi:MAG: hypothetical protein AVDCRST_MAG23-24, partial [uncultured Sphingosinicella sp.]
GAIGTRHVHRGVRLRGEPARLVRSRGQGAARADHGLPVRGHLRLSHPQI